MEGLLYEKERVECILGAFRIALGEDPDCAVDIAMKNYDCDFFSEFLDILNEEPAAAQTMLIVLKLAMKICLPEVFIVNYIYNCIECCRQQGFAVQRKTVRLLCLFLLKALESKIFSNIELVFDIYAFGSLFLTVPEAKTLCEVLKNDYSCQYNT